MTLTALKKDVAFQMRLAKSQKAHYIKLARGFGFPSLAAFVIAAMEAYKGT